MMNPQDQDTSPAEPHNAFPFLWLPVELQSQILSYCPKWALLAPVSRTCKQFRDLCVRLYLREMGVCWPHNNFYFQMLDRYPHLRTAVRYIKVHAPKTMDDSVYPEFPGPPDTEIMAKCNQQLIDGISRGSFEALKTFEIEYYICHTDYFIKAMNQLSKYQPSSMKTLEIEICNAPKNPEDCNLQDPKQENIFYPQGMKFINVHCACNVYRIPFDPFNALKSSLETITILEINLNRWEDHYATGIFCPKLKILKVSQDVWEPAEIAENLNKVFPNVEDLWLDPNHPGVPASLRQRKTIQRLKKRYMQWNAMAKVKRVGMLYREDHNTTTAEVKAHQEYVVPIVMSLIEGWIANGKMRNLEFVHCPRFKELDGVNLEFKFRVIRHGGRKEVENVMEV